MTGPVHDPARELSPAHDLPGTARPASHAARDVPALLLALRQAGFTGAVTVSGPPGGTVHLEGGLITAIDTPGAPGAETLLLKSRRVGEADWNDAETAAAAIRPTGAPPIPGGDLGAALVARGAIGAGELETVCAAAAFDGAFALALSPPGSWDVVETAPPARIALRPGVEPQRLFEEAARRVALVTGLWGPPGELAHTRIRPAAQAGSRPLRIPARYREILIAATGRRTARDIGFTLGRGVFAVLLDLARMDAQQLLHREPVSPADGVPSVAPRVPPSGPPPGEVGPLPRRIPGVRSQGSPGGAGPGTSGASRGAGVPPPGSDPDAWPIQSQTPAAASGEPPNEHRAE